MITNVVTPQYRSGHLVKAFVSALGHVRTSLLVLFPQCQACSIIFHLNFYHLSFCKHNSIVTLSHYAKKKKKIGQKVHSAFSIPYCGKTGMNFLANPIDALNAIKMFISVLQAQPVALTYVYMKIDHCIISIYFFNDSSSFKIQYIIFNV